MPQDGYEASALQGLSLWPKSGVTLPSAKEWHDAVERGRGIGWIRLRGSTTSALAALNSLAVPQVSLENLRETLAICAEEAPVVQVIGQLHVVTAQVPAATRTSSGDLHLNWQTVRIIASTKSVITLTGGPTADGQDGVDRVLDSVDLDAAPESRPNGYDLGLRILLAVAEACDAAVNESTRQLDRATGNADLVNLQSVFDRLERNVTVLRRRGRATATAWLPATVSQDAAGIAELLDDALRRLRVAKDEAVRREARLRAESQRRSADAIQIVLGTIAAVLLGPSLVAGVFEAFPGWQPVNKRGESFIGLSIASGGALWLVVYALPVLLAQRRRSVSRIAAAVGLGVVPLAVGLVLALPLSTGSDGNPPEITVQCPESVPQGASASAAVAASDAEGTLVVNPSGFRPLSTKRAGIVTRTFRAVDSFGHASTASCTYRVERMVQHPRQRSGRNSTATE